MRFGVLSCLSFLSMTIMTGCPGSHVAEKTSHSSPQTLPPAMTALAPKALTTITHLRAPESVLHDPEQDLYFISNINGSMVAHDGNGFISRVHPGSMTVDLKWIESGRNGVTLDAPKGTCIVGETLYVSDINCVRMFDRRSGSPRGTIELPGSTFANDLVADGETIYVSDTGITLGPGKTFIDTGSQAIWKINHGHAERIAAGSNLGHPNGLDVVNGELRVVTFLGDELYHLEDDGKEGAIKTPTGQLDGLVHLDDGSAVVTSWRGNEIFRAKSDGTFQAILGGISAPADIGYDRRRHLLLVPSPPSNQVTIHSLR